MTAHIRPYDTDDQHDGDWSRASTDPYYGGGTPVQSRRVFTSRAVAGAPGDSDSEQDDVGEVVPDPFASSSSAQYGAPTTKTGAAFTRKTRPPSPPPPINLDTTEQRRVRLPKIRARPPITSVAAPTATPAYTQPLLLYPQYLEQAHDFMQLQRDREMRLRANPIYDFASLIDGYLTTRNMARVIANWQRGPSTRRYAVTTAANLKAVAEAMRVYSELNPPTGDVLDPLGVVDATALLGTVAPDMRVEVSNMLVEYSRELHDFYRERALERRASVEARAQLSAQSTGAIEFTDEAKAAINQAMRMVFNRVPELETRTMQLNRFLVDDRVRGTMAELVACCMTLNEKSTAGHDQRIVEYDRTADRIGELIGDFQYASTDGGAVRFSRARKEYATSGRRRTRTLLARIGLVDATPDLTDGPGAAWYDRLGMRDFVTREAAYLSYN